MMNIMARDQEQNTNSTDVPGNLWLVEMRSIEQLLGEIGDLIDPVKIEFKNRETLIANDKITIELVNDDIIYDEVGAIVNPSNSLLDHNYGLSDQISSIGGAVVEQESKEWVETCGELPVG